jgi:hypothetical protein
MICHCQTFRRISGAPVVAWLSIETDDFAITRGHAKDYVSSEGVHRQFCGRCGAQLTYAVTDDEEWIDVATATLDDPDAFPPTHHSWTSHDIAWIKFGDKLPSYKKSRSDG